MSEVDRGYLEAAKQRIAELEAERDRPRETLAQWMIDRSYATGHGDTVEDLLKELDWQLKEERDKLREQLKIATEALVEARIRLTDLFNRHERPTYRDRAGADSDLALILASLDTAQRPSATGE